MENIEQKLIELFREIKSKDTRGEWHEAFKLTREEELLSAYIPAWNYDEPYRMPPVLEGHTAYTQGPVKAYKQLHGLS